MKLGVKVETVRGKERVVGQALLVTRQKGRNRHRGQKLQLLTLWGLPASSMHHFFTGVRGMVTFSNKGWTTTVKSSLVSYRPLLISSSVAFCRRRWRWVGMFGETVELVSSLTIYS